MYGINTIFFNLNCTRIYLLLRWNGSVIFVTTVLHYYLTVIVTVPGLVSTKIVTNIISSKSISPLSYSFNADDTPLNNNGLEIKYKVCISYIQAHVKYTIGVNIILSFAYDVNGKLVVFMWRCMKNIKIADNIVLIFSLLQRTFKSW